MDVPIIYKDLKKFSLTPNLTDYHRCYQSFSWTQARANIKGYGKGINIAFEAVDRHVEEGHGEQHALIWLGKKGDRQTYTYTDLKAVSNRFANLLVKLGVKQGDRIFSLAGRTPQLYAAILGTLKMGGVFCPLFSAFGPEPIQSRMTIGDASILVSSLKLYKKKVAAWQKQLSTLKHVLLYDCEGQCPEGCIDLDSQLPQADDQFTVCETSEETPALLHFTSGTTGKPKGAVHVHNAVVHHKHSGFYALDLHPGDRYWCTADPGWVTGTSYGIIAPLCNRVTLIVDEAEFDPERWYQILEQEKVNVWYTAPTAIRMLMKVGEAMIQQYNLRALRFLASVGEPLNPEAVTWSQRVFGKPFHDNWWQTETGGIMLANFAAEPVKPGSMGRPLPGIHAAIVSIDEQGQLTEVKQHGEIGELALKPGWPSMFRNYLHEAERYQKCFNADWYLSGDLAYEDHDGYFWFVGRSKDLIKSAGHLIGPFEVESVLVEHPAVAEAGVIGIPDEVAGEVVVAFVALKPGFNANDELTTALMAHARKKLGSAVAPRAIHIKDNLPKTRSGKIMRRLLKARELGLPEGDISTLESDEHPQQNMQNSGDKA
ncbi:acetate--CoA ligase [Zooshikella marina]|uniref:acetate--CoA ligase n=1 Tax=Zooshikella ganghwensis TaxID=202772 RepID=UPI001BAE5EF1|nr:acetate--CoA ligase [Zooshikella ganghwensis]MBU2704962.1 acetate--CoA ligase [Zooshikella ganghwensis]